MTAGTYITVVNTVDVHRSGLCDLDLRHGATPTKADLKSLQVPEANLAKLVEVGEFRTKIQTIQIRPSVAVVTVGTEEPKTTGGRKTEGVR